MANTFKPRDNLQFDPNDCHAPISNNVAVSATGSSIEYPTCKSQIFSTPFCNRTYKMLNIITKIPQPKTTFFAFSKIITT